MINVIGRILNSKDHKKITKFIIDVQQALRDMEGR